MKKKVLLATVALMIAVAIAYGLTLLPKWAILVWAILVTLALPFSIWGAWTFGRYEATALLKGIDEGIGRVASAALRLKVRERQAPVQVAVLPSPAMIHRLPSGESEIIEL